MDMQQALRARLIAAPAIASIVGDKVHWVSRPQGEAPPAIVLTTVSDDRPKHLQGYQELRSTRVQCDCWSPRYGEARALAEAAIDVLSPPHTGNGVRFDHALADGPRDLGEMLGGDRSIGGLSFIHRASVDFIIWHAASE